MKVRIVLLALLALLLVGCEVEDVDNFLDLTTDLPEWDQCQLINCTDYSDDFDNFLDNTDEDYEYTHPAAVDYAVELIESGEATPIPLPVFVSPVPTPEAQSNSFCVPSLETECTWAGCTCELVWHCY